MAQQVKKTTKFSPAIFLILNLKQRV